MRIRMRASVDVAEGSGSARQKLFRFDALRNTECALCPLSTKHLGRATRERDLVACCHSDNVVHSEKCDNHIQGRWAKWSSENACVNYAQRRTSVKVTSRSEPDCFAVTSLALKMDILCQPSRRLKNAREH